MFWNELRKTPSAWKALTLTPQAPLTGETKGLRQGFHLKNHTVYRGWANSHPEFGQAEEALFSTEADPLAIESIVSAVGKPEEPMKQDGRVLWVLVPCLCF